MAAPDLRLLDAPDEAGRTTASLFASLAGRLIALHYTSGVSVVGSTLAGLAEAGREISRTAEGARLRRAIAASPAFANGELIWRALKVADWTQGMPAAPVLDHVRNDLALLLAADLAETVDNVPAPGETRLRAGGGLPPEITFLDTLMGLWVQAREIVASVEAIAAQAPRGPVIDAGDPVHRGPILR